MRRIAHPTGSTRRRTDNNQREKIPDFNRTDNRILADPQVLIGGDDGPDLPDRNPRQLIPTIHTGGGDQPVDFGHLDRGILDRKGKYSPYLDPIDQTLKSNPRPLKLVPPAGGR